MNPWMTAEDEAALAQFEAIVQQQTPAVAFWVPVTAFDFESRQRIEGEHPQRIKEAFQPVRVIDAGCGPGHLVRLLRDLDIDAVGFDKKPYSREGIVQADLADPELTNKRPSNFVADLVICREVLEHLTALEVRHAVRNLCRLSSRFVYITTRFISSPTSLLAVAQSDDLDPTHITLLNQAFLRALIVLEGFKRRADLEERLDWHHKGRCLVYERAA